MKKKVSKNKKNKPPKEISKTSLGGGGLYNYLVNKEEKEVIFYLDQPFPTVLAIPSLMKERFPADYKSIVTRDLDEFKKLKEELR